MKWELPLILVDVNVLVYAHREDASEHDAYLAWLEDLINSDQAYGVSELVLSGFLRVVTHPLIFNPPSNLASAIAFTDVICGQPNAVFLAPGPRHWEIFKSLRNSAQVKGNLIPDAYLAALAIESGSTWVTTDLDYSRFPGLNWFHPLRN